ncbi:ABC transporter permease [Halorientalis sp.]|uniref:ABC transporter permease n=1 Tax=Halorientalis sp. TaxID=1931229 RepID=UPI002627B4DE|nr:ABC transporter permease [Halorientalis sp.]
MASSDPRVAIARRDLASLSREKTIVLALLIQLFVAAFSSFLVVGLTSLYDPGASASGRVEVGVTGEANESLLRAIEETDSAEATVYRSNATAFQGFQNGAVDAVMIATRQPDSRISIQATAPEGSIRTTLVVVQLREVLQTFERQQRNAREAFLETPPVPLPGEVSASPYFGFTYTILLPLLLFLPPFISGSVAVDAITEEIERGTLDLLRVAPLDLVDIVDGKAAAMAALAPVQALLWIVLLSFNGINVSNVPLLLVTVGAMASIVVVVGVTLGLVMGERRSAQLLYSIGVLGLFASAVFLPEHPATTVAKLAVDSATTTTYVLVVVYVAVAVGLYGLARRYTRGLDVESL